MDDVIANTSICVKFKERMVYYFRTHVTLKNKTSQLVMKKEMACLWKCQNLCFLVFIQLYYFFVFWAN